MMVSSLWSVGLRKCGDRVFASVLVSSLMLRHTAMLSYLS